MVEESNIAAGCRCDDRSSQDTKIPAFVPPRPRDRRRLGKGDSRAGYWCRRTACLAKKVAVASREAREATKLVRDMVDMVVHSHKHTHTPHPHTPEGSESGSSRGSAKGSSPSDMECGGSPGGVRAGTHNVDCDSDSSRAMVVQAIQQVRQEFQAAQMQQLQQMQQQREEAQEAKEEAREAQAMIRAMQEQIRVVQGQLQELKEKEIQEQLRVARLQAAHRLQAAIRGHQATLHLNHLSVARRGAAAVRLQAVIRGRCQFHGCKILQAQAQERSASRLLFAIKTVMQACELRSVYIERYGTSQCYVSYSAELAALSTLKTRQ